MFERIYLYPVWLRIWHSVNGLLCIILIITGLSMQYSSLHYLMIPFKTSIKIHNICGPLLSMSYLIYLIGSFLFSNIKFYNIQFPEEFPDIMTQIRYYSYHIFKGEDEPFPINKERKFNPLQKVSYVIVMFIFMPCIIISGFGMMFPGILLKQLFGIGGFLFTDVFHIIIGFIISIFIVIHFYFAFLSNSLKSIINGWHEN